MTGKLRSSCVFEKDTEQKKKVYNFWIINAQNNKIKLLFFFQRKRFYIKASYNVSETCDNQFHDILSETRVNVEKNIRTGITISKFVIWGGISSDKRSEIMDAHRHKT